jgi:phytoene dehydrogenase-like protein
VLHEANDTIGGGLRSGELTLPGFVHDVCSSVHPMGPSPFFRSLPLDKHGLEWITPRAAVAHPLDGGDAVVIWNDLERTAESLGSDRQRYLRTIGAVARAWEQLEGDLMSPLGFPARPFSYARFGIQALLPAHGYANAVFTTSRVRSMFAGLAAHSMLPLTNFGSAAVALALGGVAHASGWPVARGGSQSIADALVSSFRSLGGEVRTSSEITTHEQLGEARRLLFDTSPQAMARIMGSRFPDGFSRKLERFPRGPGVFKIDWALNAPIPWAAKECLEASTVHVGGTLAEIAVSEAAPWQGKHAEKPYVLLTQPSLFDSTRAPTGNHTAWGYVHVPNGSTVDMTEAIESQVERFAPGFRDVVIARSVRTTALIEAGNANFIGGDIGTGSLELLHLLLRPTWRHYATPDPRVFLCSAATPPGPGIHGMCGYHAATKALKDVRRKQDDG